MNLISAFEELNKLYESVEKAVEEEETLVEAAEEEEDEEIVIEDDEPAEEPAVEQQFVLECQNCGGVCIKHEADVKIDEEADLANMEEACQYCEETAGYKIIGTFIPYEQVEAEEEPVEEVEEDEPASDDEEVVEEGLFGVDLPINVDIEANGNTVPVLNTTV